MKKEKVIEVTECDFCTDGRKADWKCAKCGKDACANCCHVYSVLAKRPQNLTDSFSFGAPFLYGTQQYAAVICDDCGKNELPTPLLGFGFASSGERAHVEPSPRVANPPAQPTAPAGAQG